jgi:uncharacterized protein (TIGR00255 family)
MTGYAYREISGEEMSVSVEIKGVNSRYLETYVNLPPWLSILETNIKAAVSSLCGRGKVEVFIRIREPNAPINISVNKNAAKAYNDAVCELAGELGYKEKPSLDTILGMEGVLEIEKTKDSERYWMEIEPIFQEAIEAFCAERIREGQHTKEDILSNVEKIEKSVQTIAKSAPVIEKSIKENIRTRFAEVLGNQIDENRILAETAALLVKYTISEEISRLDSHLGEFRLEAEKNPRPGKKLDFLCQEINREINTIGSKGVIIEVSSEVVIMKEDLENIRDQLRNVE